MLTCLDQGAGCLHSVWLMRQPSQTPSFFATLQVHTHTSICVWDYPVEPVPEGKNSLDFTESRDSEWQ